MHSTADAQWNEGTIEKLQKWAADKEAVRAVLLTGNRVGPPGSYDALSDFDVVLVVRDVHPFHADRAWIGDFGVVLVTYWDALYADQETGLEIFANVIQYKSGLRIDFTLWPVEKARRVGQTLKLPAGLDVGYSVLVDKDNLATGFSAPTFMAFAQTRPSAVAFARFVEEFYSDAPAVAKYLMRGDSMPAKWVLDHDMKQVYLRRLLEWKIALDTDWNVQFRSLGKGLQWRMSDERWKQLQAGYAGSAIEDNWRALDATLAIFRDVGEDVAHRLGFAYPVELDRQVREFLRRYRREGEAALAGSMHPRG
ncbi:MAG: aminoglycoside 6-adenylyltransferase [Chloroflexi bacterium]|nr:aminoglycoside 6-adenylyltransferase [Chloroflexota bacterium]